MDAAATLDSLSTLLTSLSDEPYSLVLHAQHMQLASRPIPEVAGQLDSAVQLLLTFYAATEQIWLPFLHERVKSLGVPDDFESVDEPVLVDLQETSVQGVSEVLELFQRAESDYLSIPVLQKNIKLLTLLHASYIASSNKSDFEPILAEEAVRSAIMDLVTAGSAHLTKGTILWDLQMTWELNCLKTTKPGSPAREVLKDHIKTLHLDRLAQIHSTHEQTLQSYSSFISEYYSASEYESQLVIASQIRTVPAKAWDKKERYELSLVNSPESYEPYVSSEQRVKSQNGALLNTLYERAIAEFAARRWDAYYSNSESQTIEVLEGTLGKYWCDYVDSIKDSGDEQRTLQILRRAVRSVPDSGEVWARYVRTLERVEESMESIEGVPESVEDVYTKALSTSLIQKRVDQIVPLVIARAGYAKRHLEDEQGFNNLITILEDGISMVRNAAKEGDPRLTLEKYLASICQSLETPFTEKALAMWQNTAKHYKSSYLAWINYSDLLIADNQYARARALFKDVCARALDWPEAIWQAWTDFEHLHGTVETIENCLVKIKGLTSKLERRRAQEATELAAAQKAWMEASFAAANEVPAEETKPSESKHLTDMSVDNVESDQQQDKKRKAEEAIEPDFSKRSRLDEKPSLKRDRENSTVAVSGLVGGTKEDDLKALFQDCGKIREIKLRALANSLIAMVEFFDKTDVPAALTKDKKRIKNEEIAVHLAWQSTLYVTNFPEEMEDASIRQLFGPYGEIFDVRWPSKKFKSTRRFCYVQYTSPSAAKRALGLHGRELGPDRTLTVYISNPERKQERTDASINEREIHVAGLSRGVTGDDLKRVFDKFGPITDVRMMLDDKGDSRGFAFVEFANEVIAKAALAANNQELKKRRIAVTLADNRVQPRNREGLSGSQSRRSRTLRIKNLPLDTQEGLLQQALEKHGDVKRLEIFRHKNEAIVELATTAEAGRLLLSAEPIKFGDRTLELIEEDLPASSRDPAKPGPVFVPRGVAGRPRAGIQLMKPTGSQKKGGASGNVASTPANGSGKDQDDFRRMLNSHT